MQVRIDPTWQQLLQPEFDKPYFELLTSYVRSEYQSTTVFPPAGQIFRAFDICPVDKVKVVILGQDPYHEPKQANGLSFSVNQGVTFPPSLQNIYKEINDDLGHPSITQGDLTPWAEQGVLLLNATLTVRAHLAGSHQGKGWEVLTDAAIEQLAHRREHLVFMLWGSYAQQKAVYIPTTKHLILKAPHPSPLSAYRGFFGCKHFSKANQYLQKHSIVPIEW
ncbi:MAG: uracil-DNA glycosylase [Paludibacteraceae bacterium]|nr:uracil-DNA glycosylase [Paludibacteraceae bacterium]